MSTLKAVSLKVTMSLLMLCAAAQTGCVAPSHYDESELIFCGGYEVFAFRIDQDWQTDRATWNWSALRCEQIPLRLRYFFKNTNECKPVLGGSAILITSSAGGVAVVRRTDGACTFYARAANAHSAELIRGRYLAVAASHRGDELQIFDLHDSRRPAVKVAHVPLKGAHGVVYDWRNDLLWALGSYELLCVRLRPESASPTSDAVRIEVLAKYDLPKPGGHDLFPYFHWQRRIPPGKRPETADGLFVTVSDTVYVFDLTSRKFVEFTPLAGRGRIKSITDNISTGRIVYHQATGPSPTSTAVRFLYPEAVRLLPQRIGPQGFRTRVYKARWNQPNPFSYRRDARLVSQRRIHLNRPRVEIIVRGGCNL